MTKVERLYRTYDLVTAGKSLMPLTKSDNGTHPRPPVGSPQLGWGPGQSPGNPNHSTDPGYGHVPADAVRHGCDRRLSPSPARSPRPPVARAGGSRASGPSVSKGPLRCGMR